MGHLPWGRFGHFPGSRMSIVGRVLLVGLALLHAAAAVAAEGVEAGAIGKDAPERHVVVKGDTLWGISGRFLKSPWRWPELWGLNREAVRNPHLIYPGDVIVLDRSGGRARLRLERDGTGSQAQAADSEIGSTVRLSPRVRSQDRTSMAISSIPLAAIGPFLSRPLVVARDTFDKSPRIVAGPESRVLAGTGDTVYVTGEVDASVPVWQVYRSSRPLNDPVTKEFLGVEVTYLGDARLSDTGEVSSFRIIRARQDIGVGDRLVAAVPEEMLAFAPRSPDPKTSGIVIGAPDNAVSEIGQYQVVVVNLGTRQGMEPGHVLALHRPARVVRPRRLPATTSNELDRRVMRSVQSEYKDQEQLVEVPTERYGSAFVFRVFEKVSFALVMNTTRSVNLLDVVRAP